MKKIMFSTTILFAFAFSAKAQFAKLTNNDNEHGLMMTVINEWCDAYFNTCFGWEFVDLNQDARVTRIKNGKWKISGSNRNQGVANGGRGSKTYTRQYKATVEELGQDKYLVHFKKQSITVFGETWLDCSRIIEL
jgi:hypothetical protein